MNLTPDEVGRRIAAARAYSGQSLDELAETLGVSAPTLRRWSQGQVASLGLEAQREEKVRLVIRATDCPPEFFGLVEDGDEDYAPFERSPGFRSRLRRIEDRLARLEGDGE